MGSRKEKKSDNGPVRPNPENWGYNPGYFGSRLTVNSLESQMSSRSRRRRRRSSRSHRDSDSSVGRRVWIGVIALALIYMGTLGAMILWKKVIKPAFASPAVQAPADTPEKPGEPSGTVAVPDGAPVRELVDQAKKSRKMIDDAQRLVRNNDPVSAEAKFREASLLMPEALVILEGWADSLRKNQRWGEARDVLKRALAIAPESTSIRIALADTCRQLQEYEDALLLAEWTLVDQPYDETAHQLIAEVSDVREDYAKSIIHWQKLSSLDSANQNAKNGLGQAYMKSGRPVDAQRIFQRVIQEDPGNTQAYYYLTVCYIQQGDGPEAMAALSRSVERFGNTFVQTWTLGKEFDPLREDPAFKTMFPDKPPEPEAM